MRAPLRTIARLSVFLFFTTCAVELGSEPQFVPRTGFVTLQFDDSNDYCYGYIYPLLQLYGFKGTFGYITESSDLGIEHAPWKMLTIYQAGHEVQDHTTRHNYLWATHVDSIDDGIDQWVPYTFANLATWDSLCQRSLFILDSLGIRVEGWNQPGGAGKLTIPGHPQWKWLGSVNDSLYALIGSKYRYALCGGVYLNTAHLNLRGHNYPDRFPFFNVPHVTIDDRPLSEIKAEIADAVASGLWYVAASHPTTPSRLVEIQKLVKWLHDTNIEVVTCGDGVDRIMCGHPDPLDNQLPQAKMLKDLDGNGKPDGFMGSCSWDTLTTSPVEGTHCLLADGDVEFYCYGPEVGTNTFSIWLKSASGAPSQAWIIMAMVDFDWRYLSDVWIRVTCPTEWTKIDSTLHSNLSISIADQVDRIAFIIRPDPGCPILVAYPELRLVAQAGIQSSEWEQDCNPKVVIEGLSNPLRIGEVLRIQSTKCVGLYDVEGRCLFKKSPEKGVVSIDTKGLVPGIFFVKDCESDRMSTKIVLIK